MHLFVDLSGKQLPAQGSNLILVSHGHGIIHVTLILKVDACRITVGFILANDVAQELVFVLDSHAAPVLQTAEVQFQRTSGTDAPPTIESEA